MKFITATLGILSLSAMILLSTTHNGSAAGIRHCSQINGLGCTVGISPKRGCQQGSTQHICECQQGQYGGEYVCRRPKKGEPIPPHNPPLFDISGESASSTSDISHSKLLR